MFENFPKLPSQKESDRLEQELHLDNFELPLEDRNLGRINAKKFPDLPEISQHMDLRNVLYAKRETADDRGIRLLDLLIDQPEETAKMVEFWQDRDWTTQETLPEIIEHACQKTGIPEISDQEKTIFWLLDQWTRKDIHPMIQAAWVYFNATRALKEYPQTGILAHMLVHCILDRQQYPTDQPIIPCISRYTPKAYERFGSRKAVKDVDYTKMLDFTNLFLSRFLMAELDDILLLTMIDSEFCHNDRHINLPAEKFLWTYCKKSVILKKEDILKEKGCPSWPVVLKHIKKLQRLEILALHSPNVWIYQKYLNLLDPESAPESVYRPGKHVFT